MYKDLLEYRDTQGTTCYPALKLAWMKTLKMYVCMVMVHVVKGRQYNSAYTVPHAGAEMESEIDCRW